MKAVDRKHWQGDWSPREVREILSIASSLKSQSGVNDRSAWEAAERVFVNGITSPRLGRRPHA